MEGNDARVNGKDGFKDRGLSNEMGDGNDAEGNGDEDIDIKPIED